MNFIDAVFGLVLFGLIFFVLIIVIAKLYMAHRRKSNEYIIIYTTDCDEVTYELVRASTQLKASEKFHANPPFDFDRVVSITRREKRKRK